MRKRHWILLIFLGILMLSAKGGAPAPAGTTYSSKPKGTKAFYLLLQKLGLPAEHLYLPFSTLANEPTGQTLLIITTPKIGDEEKLLSWVRNGNRLILFYQHGTALTDLLKRLEIKESLPNLGEINISGSSDQSQSVQCNDPKAELKLCKPPLVVSVPQSLSALRAPKNSRVYLKDQSKDLLFQTPLGKGDVWVFSGIEPISNQYIDKHDNLKLLYSLTHNATKIVFDEFHHGYTAPLDAAQQSVWNSVILLMVCIAVVLLLSTLVRAVRFGPPIFSPVSASSASLDFVRVLGVLYQERNVQNVLAKYLLSWRTRVERTFRISAALSNGQLIKEMVYQGLISDSETTRCSNALALLERSDSSQKKRAVEEAVLTLERIFRAASFHTTANSKRNIDDKSTSISANL